MLERVFLEIGCFLLRNINHFIDFFPPSSFLLISSLLSLELSPFLPHPRYNYSRLFLFSFLLIANTPQWLAPGPTANTPTLLATLKAANVKATFFVMGSNVIQNPDILKQELADGHHLASHTWSHKALTTLSNEQIVAELKWTEKAVQEITGHQMKYVRPPYGDIDNRVRAVCKALGYIIVDW